MTDALLLIFCILSLLSAITGPLANIPTGIPGVSLYLTDIFLGILILTWFVKIGVWINLIKKSRISKAVLLFISVLTVSLILSPVNLTFSQRLISFLYILRFSGYFIIYITVSRLLKIKKMAAVNLVKIFTIITVALSIIGWLQYLLYPDLRNLYYLGWDPHFRRIFSTYLDPNYFGLMLLLGLIQIFFTDGSLLRWPAMIFVFLTLAFTYSRSSFTAGIISTFYYSFTKRKIYLAVGIILLLIFTVLLLPRPPGSEGVKLERIFTVEDRITNWKLAFQIFTDHPVLGVGFDALRYAKYRYGVDSSNWLESHSGAGIDNSFLFILASTGLAGFAAFIYMIVRIYLVSDFPARISLAAVLVHSLFLNSFFLPWVMLWLWAAVALGEFRGSK